MIDYTGQPANNLDPKILKVVRALKDTETGGSARPYEATGDAGTSHGAFQFQDATWKDWAGKYLGDPNAKQTPANQNFVAYHRVADRKAAGLQPEQIASEWNSGDPNAYMNNHRGSTTINGQKIQYDTPAYVERFKQNLTKSDSTQGQDSTYALQTPQETRQSMIDNGQPVSVNPNKTQPTFLGNLVRGVIKLPAEIGASAVNLAQAATGQPITETFKSPYLVDIHRVGAEFDPAKGISANKEALKESLGAGIEAATYGLGGGEIAGALDAAKTGSLLSKGILKTVGKNAVENAGIGALGGIGTGLQEKGSTVGSVATNAGIGGLLGAGIGGATGAIGSALEKTGVLSSVLGNSSRVAKAKDDLYKAYEEATSTRKSDIKFAMKDQAIGKDTMQDLVDHGIVPEFNKDGTRMDMSKGMAQVDASDEIFKPALSQAIQAENKQVSWDTFENALKSSLTRYKNTAEESALTREIESRLAQFKATNQTPDLALIQDIKNKAAQDSKGAYNPLNDATISARKKAAKEIFFAAKKTIEENVSKDSPIYTINQVLEKNHRMQELMGMLNGSVVARGKIGKYVAENIGAMAGLHSYGLGGSLAGMKLAETIQSVLMKSSMGSPASRALLETLQATDQNLYKEVLQNIAKQQEKTASIPKLPAPGQTSSKVYVSPSGLADENLPKVTGAESTLKQQVLDAASGNKISAADKRQNLKVQQIQKDMKNRTPGVLNAPKRTAEQKYTPVYQNENALPIIKFGSKGQSKLKKTVKGLRTIQY